MASKRRLATLYATCISLSPLAPPSALIPPLLPSATCLEACKHCVFQEQNQQGDLWILNRARCCVPPGSYWQLYRQLIGGAMPVQQGRPAPILAVIKGSHIYIRIVTSLFFFLGQCEVAPNDSKAVVCARMNVPSYPNLAFWWCYIKRQSNNSIWLYTI